MWNRAKTEWRWRYKFTLQIAMCAKPTLLWVQRIFGGTVKPRPMPKNKPQYRQQWVWLVADAQAERVLGLIHPHMHNKFNEAEIAMRFRAAVDGKRLLPDTLARQERFSNQMKVAKRVEYPRV
jgi:hypothetical protein